MDDRPGRCPGPWYAVRCSAPTRYTPDRNAVNRMPACRATARQYCHLACEPAPSKDTMMNCGGRSPGLSRVGVKNESGSTPPGRPALPPAPPVPAPPGWLPPEAPPAPAGVPADAPVPDCPVPLAPTPLPVPVAVLRASTVNATAAISAHTSQPFRLMASCPSLRTPRGTPVLPAAAILVPHRTTSAPTKTPAGPARLTSSDAAQATRVGQNCGHGSPRLASLVKPP